MGKSQYAVLREAINSLSSSEGSRLQLSEKIHLSKEDIQVLKSVIRQSAQTLRHLELVDDNITFSDISVLKASLTPTRKLHQAFKPADVDCGDGDGGEIHLLESLNLNRNKIGSNGGEIIGEIVRYNPLSCLKIVKNDLRSAGIVEIFNALTFNPGYLKFLDLTNNQVCPIGAKRMSQLLVKPKLVLKSLNLAFNEIGNRGVFWLCLALSLNQSLTDLNLAHNSLTDACIESLVSSLAENKTLTSLNLSYNDFTDAGLQSLLCGLEKCNFTLLSLTIKNQSVPREIIEKAASICKRNKTHLEMLSNSIHIGRKLSLLSTAIPPEIASMILKQFTRPLLSASQHHAFASSVLSRSSFGTLISDENFTAAQLNLLLSSRR